MKLMTLGALGLAAVSLYIAAPRLSQNALVKLRANTPLWLLIVIPLAIEVAAFDTEYSMPFLAAYALAVFPYAPKKRDAALWEKKLGLWACGVLLALFAFITLTNPWHERYMSVMAVWVVGYWTAHYALGSKERKNKR